MSFLKLLSIVVSHVIFILMLAACTTTKRLENFQTQGWIEATAIVSNIKTSEAFFIETAGYERIYAGTVPRSVLQLWNLPATASGKEVVVAEPGSNRGLIRLVQLDGVGKQIEGRSAGQFFDTGGIMGLNVRVHNIDLAFKKLQTAGWRPYADPVRFSVEEFSVAEAIFQGPDGLVIGLIERERPALGPEWNMTAEQLSRPNNAFLTTADLPTAVNFYTTQLGWSVFLRDAGKAAPAGMNLYGWPHNLVQMVEREVVWVHPGNNSEGSIALINLEGVSGRDFSSTVLPPNYGWVALRMITQAESADAPDNSGNFALPPYGCVTMHSYIAPDGVRIEQIQQLKQDC